MRENRPYGSVRGVLGDRCPYRDLMAGTMSRTPRAVAARRGLEEGVRKVPARGTRSTYEAAVSGRRGNNTESPIVIRKRQL